MTDAGMLQYTVPSFMELQGLTYEQLSNLDWITYVTSLASYDETTLQTYILQCPSYAQQNCYVTMARAYTPILYYMSPPVVFFGSETSFWVDPRST